MTRLEFNELVERLADRYDGRPRRLAWSTAFWLAGGYLVLFSGLASALIGGLAMIGVGLWLAHHAAAWLVAGGAALMLIGLGLYGRFIWTPRVRGKEFVLKPGDAPELFALIGELCRIVGCRPFHRVLLNAELNAGVSTEPRFGLLGGSRKILSLGLPLLESLAPEEFRAVLAHEFVHHSRNHGRFAVWVYRVRNTWEKVYNELESGNWNKSVRWARWFLRWYWPRMNARAFLLCREQEYAADQFAAEHAGAEVAARALWRIETTDRYLDLSFWPVIQRLPEHSAEPPGDIMTQIVERLSTAPPREIAAWCAATTLGRLTDTADTHPSWTERTTAMGEDPIRMARHGYLRKPDLNAAVELLGATHLHLSRELSRIWSELVRESWKSQHRRLTGQRRRLQQIAPLLESRPDDLSLRTEQARLIHEIDGPEAVRPLLEQLRAVNPQHRGTTFELGQLALASGDPSGARLLEEIVHQQRDAFYVPACAALCHFFRMTGRFDDMREMEARLDGRDAWDQWIRDGHRHLTRGVSCLPHDLTTEQLASAVNALNSHADVAAAWLVRVESQFPGAPPLYVLCVSATGSALDFWRADREKRLAHRLVGQVPFPGRVLIITTRGSDTRLARRVHAIPGSQIIPTDPPIP